MSDMPEVGQRIIRTKPKLYWPGVIESIEVTQDGTWYNIRFDDPGLDNDDLLREDFIMEPRRLQCNGFEIDEDNPMVPLSAVMKLGELIDGGGYMTDFIYKMWLDELGIPMHILAETDQAIGEEEKKTPEEWCHIRKVRILDPDGWRMKDAPAWSEPITLKEFEYRADLSTQYIRAEDR